MWRWVSKHPIRVTTATIKRDLTALSSVKQLTVLGKRNKLRVIDLEDGSEDFGLKLFSSLPATLETKALFWHRPPRGKRAADEPAARACRQVL